MQQAAQQAQGIPAAPPTPAATGKAATYEKDKADPYANVGRNDPCPCGSGKKFKNAMGPTAPDHLLRTRMNVRTKRNDQTPIWQRARK